MWYMCIYPMAQQVICLQSSRHMIFRFNPWVRKIPWKKKWQPTPVFLFEKSHGERSLAAYSPWDHKELDTTEHVFKYTCTKEHFNATIK